MVLVVRYLSLLALAAVITLSAFYLMHRLIDRDTTVPASQPPVTMIRFGPIDIPDPTEPDRPEPPERPEPKEPPPSSQVIAEFQPIERTLDLEPADSALADPVSVLEGNFMRPNQADSRNARPDATVPPPYPRDAALEGIEGWVRMAIEIDASGRVVDVRVIQAEPAGVFERTAVRAVRRWTWKPAVIGGEPQAQTVLKELTFKLDDA